MMYRYRVKFPSISIVVVAIVVLFVVATSRTAEAFSSSLVSSTSSSSKPTSSSSSSLDRTSSSSNKKTNNDNNNNRVFVGGLNPTCDRDTLQADLEEKYGPVEDVFIFLKETSQKGGGKPYAFVEFCNEIDAQNAIEGIVKGKGKSSTSRVPLYNEIKVARRHVPKPKTILRKESLHKEYEAMLQLAKTSKTIIQVHKSHLDRLIDFIDNEYRESMSNELTAEDDKEEASPTMATTGICLDTTCKSIALLGVTIEINKLKQWFKKVPFPIIGVNKIYSVNPTMLVIGGGQRRQRGRGHAL